MKKILFLLMSVLVLFASCDKKDSKLKLRHDATVMLKSGVQARAQVEGKTAALEIVQETANMRVQSYRFGHQVFDEIQYITYGFAERQRDYDTPALLMLSDDIIDVNGNLVLEFIESFDVFLTNNDNDTIAYIPNQILIDAKVAILDAYDRQDYETVYELFENAYKFYPID